MAKLDPQALAHIEWLGFVQPTGLVVSAPALVRAGAILDRRDAEGQRLLRDCLDERSLSPDAEPEPVLTDFRAFARAVLGWSLSPKGYAGTGEAPIPEELEVVLQDRDVALRPDLAVRELEPEDGSPSWQLLVSIAEAGEDLDRMEPSGGGLGLSPHGCMERLLRQAGVPAGLLFNGQRLRLISAPHGESSGWLDFEVAAMAQTAGRPICTALRLLLSESRLLSLPKKQRLPALLEDSRKFQNEVSEKLAEQVLHSLYELLRGFQAAHDASDGALLRDALEEDPDEVYRALLIVILRMVFLLYAEEREMLPEDEVFVRHYSLAGLYEQLHEDNALNPDTMGQRFGAWAQLLVLFRMVFDGAEAGMVKMPRRHGVLFDPDRYPFLEGRIGGGSRQTYQRIDPPLVPDGTVYRALDKLLVLDGERISYRALDVEQIGSVYETMMGFRLESAIGRAVAIRAQKKQGAPTTLDLDALLEVEPGRRKKWIQDRADRKLTAKVEKPVKEADSIEALHAALAPVTDNQATPDLVSPGAMVLQPSEERRRSGSHYTPRELTEPIVRTTLEPILERLTEESGTSPTPEQVLELKVCDPAMGSGAFLVEACRQLADALIEAWAAHDERPEIPPDEDEVIFARRLVAQRCLYGVDRNPVAVDLAKMSLWLATLAREHPLTFVDHALRHGDSLVGLSRRQIEAFHWDESAPGFEAIRIRGHIDRVTELRAGIRDAGEGVSDWELTDLWDEAQAELEQVRFFGDLVCAAFFLEEKGKDRETRRLEFADAASKAGATRHRGLVEELASGEPPLVPFHWEIEFPEVYDRPGPGFDCMVGNPPFMGGTKVSRHLGRPYLDWLLEIHPGSHGNGDLVSHFFRRAFCLLRGPGALGLIATNTIAQGDTRTNGLAWICRSDGTIFSARRRVPWPGSAAVVVSIVHIAKRLTPSTRQLDGRTVEMISAFLFHRGGSKDPERLAANHGLSFLGTTVYGKGFTFDDSDPDGKASPVADMDRLLHLDSRNREAIFPLIGGAEINATPTQDHHRWVINFGDRSERECRTRWPSLMEVVEEKVKPERMENRRERRRKYWWQFGETTPGLFAAVEGLDRVLATSQTSSTGAFAFLSARMVYSHKVIVFPLGTYAAFASLQNRCHGVWARFFGSSMKDDPVYTPSDCFETFPFPGGWMDHPDLEKAGQAYYTSRADLMVRNDEGLTKTYNRFHDPDEQDPEIEQLRGLHAEMDQAVLAAYGWEDVPTDCDFLLDYEIDEGTWGRKKKPYRYRWPNEVRDDVLARLIELNGKRAAEEARVGAGEASGKPVRDGSTSAQSEALF